MDNLRARAIGAEGADRPAVPLEGLLDINLLPERYQRARISWLSVLAWLALIILFGLLVPTYQQWQASSIRLNSQRSALAQAQAEMQAMDPNAEARAKLQEQIDAAHARADDLRSAAAAISIQDVQWGTTIATIRAAQVDDLRLTEVAVDGGSVNLSGDAKSYSLPLDYAAALRSRGDFQSVVVESIAKFELTPEQQAELAGESTATSTVDATAVPDGAAPMFRYAFEISVVVRAPEAVPAEVTSETQ